VSQSVISIWIISSPCTRPWQETSQETYNFRT
jgi:hypothetical protein